MATTAAPRMSKALYAPSRPELMRGMRRWIGIDLAHLSISRPKHRLESMFPRLTVRMVSEPEELAATLGLFIGLEAPTREMEAAKQSRAEEAWAVKQPRLVGLTDV